MRDDSQAFATLYRRYRDSLYALCVARTGDRTLAEDIVQDAFTKAYTNFAHFDRSRPFWPWLSAIAIRECVDRHRRASYAESRTVELAAALTGPEEAAEAVVVRRMDHDRLDAAIAGLPVRQRAALRLFAVEGWTYGEIADRFGCSVVTVKGLIARGRAHVRDVAVRWAGVAVSLGRAWQARLASVVAHGHSVFGGMAEMVGAVLRVSPVEATAAVLVLAGLLAPALPDRPSPTMASGPQRATGVGDRPPSVVASKPDALLATDDFRMSDEPVLRRHQRDTERTAHEALAPVLPPPPSDEGPDNPSGGTVAVSPDYDNDHTMFVTGPCCDYFRPPPLYASHDGGATWARKRALGFAGSRRLLFAPAYPRDPRLFSIDSRGLQVSRDGGDSFQTLAVQADLIDAAISPGFDRDDPVILLVGTVGVFEYRDDTTLVTPLVVDGEHADRFSSVGYATDANGAPLVFLGGVRPVDGKPWDPRPYAIPSAGVVGECRLGPTAQVLGGASRRLQCVTRTVPGTLGGLRMLLPPVAATPTMFVQEGVRMHLSTDGGRTFREVFDGVKVTAFGVVRMPAPDGMRYLAAVARWAPEEPVLLRTDDAGATWAPLSVDLAGFEYGALTAVVTPTGRIVAVGTGEALACSVDDGRTWAAVCPTPDTA